jgi:hypothetical protein
MAGRRCESGESKRQKANLKQSQLTAKGRQLIFLKKSGAAVRMDFCNLPFAFCLLICSAHIVLIIRATALRYLPNFSSYQSLSQKGHIK